VEEEEEEEGEEAEAEAEADPMPVPRPRAAAALLEAAQQWKPSHPASTPHSGAIHSLTAAPRLHAQTQRNRRLGWRVDEEPSLPALV
tara:strand:- start:680 stop:940 length:261 start_codon:yes stop_codon:yes gene_type:complete